MQESVITEAFFSFEIDGVKEAEDLLRIKEPDEGFLSALLGDGEDGLCQLSLVG